MNKNEFGGDHRMYGLWRNPSSCETETPNQEIWEKSILLISFVPRYERVTQT